MARPHRFGLWALCLTCDTAYDPLCSKKKNRTNTGTIISLIGEYLHCASLIMHFEYMKDFETMLSCCYGLASQSVLTIKDLKEVHWVRQVSICRLLIKVNEARNRVE